MARRRVLRRISVRARATLEGDRLEIDLSESSAQVAGFINSAHANTRSLAHAEIMHLSLSPYDVPKNEGSMAPLEVIAPRGLIVNASSPAPVRMSANHCAEEIVEPSRKRDMKNGRVQPNVASDPQGRAGSLDSPDAAPNIIRVVRSQKRDD